MGTRGDRDGTLLGRGGLRLGKLRKATARPALYAGGERSFWTDPYVSRHVLEAHLDPHTDDASRRPGQIAATVDAVLEHLRGTPAGERNFSNDGEPPRLIDLACGPGLYAQQFAARGIAVTGVDYSRVSLDYARREAKRERLPIEYREEDFTVSPLDGPWDAVTLIYGAFCTISEAERASLLERVYDALAPGGIFVFDVFTERYVKRNRGRDEWYVGTRNGFWQSDGHLVLERHYFYTQESASVTQYTIVAEDGSYRQYHVWWRHFTREEIVALVSAAGFIVDATAPSLWGMETDPPGEWIGVFARRPTRA